MIYISIVKHLRFRDRIRSLAFTFRNAMVQDCPSELYACEVCGQLNCSSNKWVSCEKRLLAAEYMQTGDREALVHLKESYQGADGTCVQSPVE
jgi:hypothetical protein